MFGTFFQNHAYVQVKRKRAGKIALTALMLVLPVEVAHADAQDRSSILKAVAADIEKLKADYPQLRDFSAATHLRAEPPSIGYASRTRSPERTGGWTSGVPSPEADGVWFHIDLHDPGSKLQLHTQPVTVPLCLGASRVSFLILEGRDTRSLHGPIWSALRKQGARECAPDTDKWLGRWTGPEGTFLQLDGGGGKYQVTIQNLDGPRTFQGSAEGNRIAFERNGVKEYLRVTNGTETGMKWLTEKADCLTVRTGEGYCR